MAHHAKTKLNRSLEDSLRAGPNNLKAGAAVVAKWRDGEERDALVVERRLIAADAPLVPLQVVGDDGETVVKSIRDISAYRYYLHWSDFNRRLDSWVSHESIRFDSVRNAQIEQQLSHKKAEKEAEAVARTGGGVGEGKSLSAAEAEAASLAASSTHHKKTRTTHSSHAAASASSSFSATATAPASSGREGSSSGNTGESLVEEDDGLGNVFRGRKRRADGTLVIEFVDPEHPEHMGEDSMRAHEEVTKVKNVNSLQLGRHRMDTWYFSAIPPEFWHQGDVESYIDILYSCEFCLKFFKHKSEMLHHYTKCTLRHPPGDEVYRGRDGIGMWELDGASEKQYCQNLAYIAKMFLDHKTLKYDVDPFLFYVMTERTEHGHSIVGYFSKEKVSEYGNNLSCILALPCHQRKGFGRFLIEFSYELSKLESKAGHPETPLSDLGLLSYRSYWSSVILQALLHGPFAALEEVSIVDLLMYTSFSTTVVENTLKHLEMLRVEKEGGRCVIVFDKVKAAAKLAKLNKPGPRVDPSLIHWAPLPPLPKDKWKISNILADLKASQASVV